MSEVNRQQLIQLMVGRELSAVFPKRTVELGEVVLELRRLGCSASGINDVNLSVRAGEIVGLAGLVGAGRTELARTIFGLTPADAGEVLLRGEPVKHRIAQRRPSNAALLTCRKTGDGTASFSICRSAPISRSHRLTAFALRRR